MRESGLRSGGAITTEVRDTHKTGFQEIEYRWHPWHGQRVLIRGEARRSGSVVLRCVQDELKGFPSLEVPEWMFDSHLWSDEACRFPTSGLYRPISPEAAAIGCDGIQ